MTVIHSPTGPELYGSHLPVDRSLPGLSLFARPERLTTMLSRLLADRLGAEGRVAIVETRLLRYVPGSRCIIQLDCAIRHRERESRSALIVKLYGHGKGAGVHATLQELMAHGLDGGRLGITPALGYDEAYDLLLLPYAAGQRLRELLLAPAPDVALADRAAEWLARLHQCGVTGGRRYDFARQAHTLALWQRRLAETLPRLGPLAAEVCERLQVCGSQLKAWPSAPTHRDFSPDHVFVDGAKVTALDFDEFCQYDPLFDVAHFVVHLHWMGLSQFGTLDHFKAFAERFESGYAAQTSRFPIERMRVHTAVAYFKIAHITAVVTRPAHWPSQVEALLLQAREHSRA